MAALEVSPREAGAAAAEAAEARGAVEALEFINIASGEVDFEGERRQGLEENAALGGYLFIIV